MCRVKEREDQLEVFPADFAFMVPSLHSWHPFPHKCLDQVPWAPLPTGLLSTAVKGMVAPFPPNMQPSREARSKDLRIQFLFHCLPPVTLASDMASCP